MQHSMMGTYIYMNGLVLKKTETQQYLLVKVMQSQDTTAIISFVLLCLREDSYLLFTFSNR